MSSPPDIRGPTQGNFSKKEVERAVGRTDEAYCKAATADRGFEVDHHNLLF